MVIGVLGWYYHKLINMLSRMVSLESLGFYMLLAVVSGFSRIATPIINAFSPQFTELVALKMKMV